MTTIQSDWFCAVIPAPFGAVGIRTGHDVVTELVYLPPGYALIPPSDSLAKETARQIQCYFRRSDFLFTLPLNNIGTAHQRKVWNAICSIPCGQVQSYGSIAKQIASAPRAVGQACGANWFPLIIPCHRVTAAHGLGGFAHHNDAAGFHLQAKRWLLAHEGIHVY